MLWYLFHRLAAVMFYTMFVCLKVNKTTQVTGGFSLYLGNKLLVDQRRVD